MKTRLSVFVAIVITTILSITKVAAEEEKPSWSVTLSTDFMNRYVGFDNGAVFYDKPMFQTDLFFLHKSGFHADAWWGTGLNKNLIGSGFDDEIDYNVGFGNIVPFTDDRVKFDVGIGYWDMFNLFERDGFDMVHPYIEVNYPINIDKRVKLTPFVKWQAYLPFDEALDEGTMTSAGCKYAVGITPKLTITGLTSFGYDDGGFGFKPGVVWKDYLNLELRLNRLTWRMVEVQVYIPVTVSDRDPEQVFGTGITWSFR